MLDSTGLLQEKRKQYLRYLQKLCSAFDLLPSSFLLPQESVKLEPTPFDSGGYSSVFKATFNERAIVIKVLNVTARTERERLHRASGLGSRTQMVAYATPIAPRQRSHRMEVAPTSEYLAVRRRHVYNFHTNFDCLGIYGKRKHHGLYQEEPGL